MPHSAAAQHPENTGMFARINLCSSAITGRAPRPPSFYCPTVEGRAGIRQRRSSVPVPRMATLDILVAWSISLHLWAMVRGGRTRNRRQAPNTNPGPHPPGLVAGIRTARASIFPFGAGAALAVLRGRSQAVSKATEWRPRRWIERVWTSFPEGCARSAVGAVMASLLKKVRRVEVTGGGLFGGQPDGPAFGGWRNRRGRAGRGVGARSARPSGAEGSSGRAAPRGRG